MSVAAYRVAIHEAVVSSGGYDAYTGEPLDWEKLSQYNNQRSQDEGVSYKAALALLPTVDHANASSKAASFKICGWRTNDAKHDLSLEAFMELCVRVLRHAGYRVDRQE